MKLTLKEIRMLSTESSFERGMEYFTQGHVKNIEQFGNKITAIVSGKQDYRVTIRLYEDDFTAECTCPYDWGGYCKHIIATLIALSKNYKEIKESKNREEEKIETILNNVSLEELKEFLRTEFENDPRLRNIFAIHFSGKAPQDKSIHDYKKEINLLYRNATGRYGFIEYGNNIDFFHIQDLAHRYIKKGNYLEAAKIYQALAETIAENMGMVDDSDGYYGGEFRDAISDFTNCIKEANLGHREKRYYIEYLFNKYIENDPDYFREEYDYALREISQSKEDLNYWKKLLAPYLPDVLPDREKNWLNYYHARELIEMQLFILDELNEKEEFYELIERFYREDNNFCLLYAEQLKKDGRLEQSIAVAEEGLKIFPKHLTSSLRLFLNTFYKKHSPEKYKENLKHLFFQGESWEYYDKLKKLCSKNEWEKLIQEMITYFGSKSRYRDESKIIDIYLREKRFDEAIEKVLSINSLNILDHYYKDLSNKYPEKYFRAYKELIIPFADSKMGRSHYRSIAYYLKRMKRIGVFKDEFREFVKMLKEKYAKRPAFLDEM
ncbi:MAG: SWIM zinc finger domain-containing protein, partial [Candidatus Aminicenantia bacterium]